MSNTIASIECSTCSALLEVYREVMTGEPNLGWTTSDQALAKHRRSDDAHMLAMRVKRRFSCFDG